MNDTLTLIPPQIVICTTRFCPDCLRAKKFFEDNNIPYLHIKLESNEEAANFVKLINNGNRSVPTIIFPDGSILVEPSRNVLEQKFK